MEVDNSSIRIPKFQFKITGYGLYLPPKVETAEELAFKINKTPGNCVAASFPLALVMARQQELFNECDLIYLVGTGAGLSIASALIRV